MTCLASAWSSFLFAHMTLFHAADCWKLEMMAMSRLYASVPHEFSHSSQTLQVQQSITKQPAHYLAIFQKLACVTLLMSANEALEWFRITAWRVTSICSFGW
jgi:hypothetical protein